MPTINVSPNSSRLRALKHAVNMNIDMLNDMAVDPMWMSPNDLRKLAAKPDDEIRKEMSKNSEEVFKNVDQLIALQFLQAELNEIE